MKRRAKLQGRGFIAALLLSMGASVVTASPLATAGGERAASGVSPATSQVAFTGKQVRVISFAHSITDAQRQDLAASGVEVFELSPATSFLIFGTADAINRFLAAGSSRDNSLGVSYQAFRLPVGGPLSDGRITISDAAYAETFLPDRVKNKAKLNRLVNGKFVLGDPAPNVDYTEQRWRRLVDSQNADPIVGVPIEPVAVAESNFEALAAMDNNREVAGKFIGRIGPNQAGIELENPEQDQIPEDRVTEASPADEVPGPSVPSPLATTNFLGQEDGAAVGTGSFSIPPDTSGAVGIDKIFSNTNSNYRVQDKATGATISTVSAATFWSQVNTGATGIFDPRVVFDANTQRWIVSAVSNAQSANSSILVGVSQTSDPSGNYNIFRFIVGCTAGAAGCNAGGEWADFPMLGYNQNWLAVSVNMFTNNTNAFVRTKTLTLDYAAARGGTSVANVININGPFSLYPVITYSGAEPTLYFVDHISSGGGSYRVSTMSGTPAVPVLTPGTSVNRTGGGWTQPGGDILPQNCVVAGTQVCPLTLRRLDAGDSFLRGAPVLRNGNIYYSQTVGLPAGGAAAMTHTAAQWTRVSTNGTFVDGGRLDDSTATATNGGKWYGYTGIAVNADNDVMLGFSEFSSAQFASAGYAMRLGIDPAGTMRDPVIYKAGQDYYEKTFGSTRNRWGDYSQVSVDPINDLNLWAVQEYAQPRVGTLGTGSNDSRWGTWWAQVRYLSISGSVRSPSPNLLPMRNLRVEAVVAGGGTLKADTTDSAGEFSIDGLLPGQVYTLRIKSKVYKFDAQAMTPTNNVTGIVFTGKQ